MVEATRAEVWALVTDINVPARFSGEFLGAEWADAEASDSGPRLGARFVGRNQHVSRGEWETTSWVNRYEPLREFGWAVSDPDHPSATWWFELAGSDGAVRLRHSARMGPAPSGVTSAIEAMPDKEERIVARRLEEWERNMRATLEGIKKQAETGA